MRVAAPRASQSTEELADWLEIQALISKDRTASLETLVNDLRRGGSTDALDEGAADKGSETTQAIGGDAFGELANRKQAADGGYPFRLDQGMISLERDEDVTKPYILLLLLSFIAPTTGYQGTAYLFEKICSHATHRYLGGNTNSVSVLHFGAPRKPPKAKMREAIDHLCSQIGEGAGCKTGKGPKGNRTGDDGLDIVAWREFPDKSAGKLIAFGQCACGATDWESKLSELDGANFVGKWFRERLAVHPIRMFFLPRRVPKQDWHDSGIDGGILFDRCRIVANLQDLDAALEDQCKRAIQALMKDVET